MKSTAQQDDASLYEIIYAAAPWIELGKTVGFFTTFQVGKNDLFSYEFTQGTDGTDQLTIFITPGDNPIPVEQQVHGFPIQAGESPASDVSTQVQLTMINQLTGEELLERRILPYGKDAYKPKPGPRDLYVLTYLSGPYAKFSGVRTAEDEVYIIANMAMRENDEVEDIFTLGGPADDYDTFELRITSNDESATKTLCRAFGPYTLANPNTVTVMASTTANGRPVQKPVGIKSYGNDSWFF